MGPIFSSLRSFPAELNCLLVMLGSLVLQSALRERMVDRYEIMKNKIAVKFCGEWFFFPVFRCFTLLFRALFLRSSGVGMGKIEGKLLVRINSVGNDFFFLPLGSVGWNKFPSIWKRRTDDGWMLFSLVEVRFSTIFCSSLKWKINILFSCAWRIFHTVPVWRRRQDFSAEGDGSMCLGFSRYLEAVEERFLRRWKGVTKMGKLS